MELTSLVLKTVFMRLSVEEKTESVFKKASHHQLNQILKPPHQKQKKLKEAFTHASLHSTNGSPWNLLKLFLKRPELVFKALLLS